MCATCGCSEGDTRIDGRPVQEHRHADGTVHSHPHDHPHDHDHPHPHRHARASPGAGLADRMRAPSRRIVVEQDLLAKNDAIAAQNRARWRARGVFAVNLVSSPGSGKTTLLVRTIERLAGRFPVAVIEGDQQTSRDAERIRAAGAPAVQINTGKGCHLDAAMVARADERLDLPHGGLLLIENVGNLVCPAAFDLGEAHKVVILSATEGEDKPLKYPDMFAASDLMLLTKVDLLPYLSFDADACAAYARRVHPGIPMLRVSSTSGDGLDEWISWLERGVARARDHRDAALTGRTSG
ncbi:MAG: hydrogenase nickel incorporation protein HypB [Burkholderiales bacterium]